MSVYKKILSVILTFFLAFAALPFRISSGFEVDDGSGTGNSGSDLGNKINYYDCGPLDTPNTVKATFDTDLKILSFADGNVTGKVEIRDYDSPLTPEAAGYEIPPWRLLETNNGIVFTELIIGNNIKTVGNGAFMNSSALALVTISGGVKTIKEYAFFGCDVITDIFFTGTKAEWSEVDISENNGVFNYSIEEMAANGITFHDICDIQGHTFNEWIQTKAPTYTENGEKEHSCVVCNYVEFEYIPKITYILGDVNEDGIIDIKDANQIISYLSKLTVFTENQLTAADVNGDGLVNIGDVVLIARYDAKFISSFP